MFQMHDECVSFVSLYIFTLSNLALVGFGILAVGKQRIEDNFVCLSMRLNLTKFGK